MESIVNFVIMCVFLVSIIIWVISLVKSDKNTRCIVDEKLCKECPFPCENHNNP